MYNMTLDRSFNCLESQCSILQNEWSEYFPVLNNQDYMKLNIYCHYYFCNLSLSHFCFLKTPGYFIKEMILKFAIGSSSHFTPIISMKPSYEKTVIQLFSSSMENKRRYLEERKISSVISTELFSQSVITRKHIEHSFAKIF